MSNPEKSLLSLQKLYAKRKELDKLITDAEKKLVADAKAPVKAPAAKKTVKKTVKKTGRPKSTAPKAAASKAPRKPRAKKA
jgi:hypothetical protein